MELENLLNQTYTPWAIQVGKCEAMGTCICIFRFLSLISILGRADRSNMDKASFWSQQNETYLICYTQLDKREMLHNILMELTLSIAYIRQEVSITHL